MNVAQANKLLDDIKDGYRHATAKQIANALQQTGDLPQDVGTFDLDGINAGREKIRMGQSTKT